jgi:Protein of unknown function (DUF3108)
LSPARVPALRTKNLVVVLSNWSRSTARSAAPAAAACALTMLAALAADVRSPALAQGRLQAQYIATISGIPVGEGTWAVEISNKEYTAVASGATAGILKLLIGAHGTGAVRGTLNGGQPVPTTYSATIIDNRRVDEVRIGLAGGNVTTYSVEPPLRPSPDRIPVTDADRRGVMDPMTSALTRVIGTGNPVRPVACQRNAAVFDGRVRYDLHSEFKRMEFVKADKGYEGPAVVCALYFRPISGYVPDRSAIKYLVELRDAEVWLAPIAGTRMLVPFRFSMPTPLGPGVLRARQFVSVAFPVRADAKTQ